jgi:hypothetical protein
MIALFAGCALSARVAGAQLTTTYSGTERDDNRDVPASAQFSLEKGRVAMIMKGTRATRMIFDQKAEVLHIVMDENRTYFDITKANAAAGDPMGMMAQMQKQLESLPKEQRAMAEQAMKAAMGGGAAAGNQPPPLTYVWTKDIKSVMGYECTRVEGMRGDDKVTEYCGSTSNDFKMSDAERQTMLEMQGYLRNFLIGVRDGNDSMRAFQWDTSVDGYPVITRCFRKGVMTLDLQLASVHRNRIPDDLFKIPSGYRKMDMSMPGGG